MYWYSDRVNLTTMHKTHALTTELRQHSSISNKGKANFNLFICLFVCLFVCLLFIYLYIYLFIYLFNNEP